MLVLRKKGNCCVKLAKERTIKTAGMNKTQKALNKMGSILGLSRVPGTHLVPINFVDLMNGRKQNLGGLIF